MEGSLRQKIESDFHQLLNQLKLVEEENNRLKEGVNIRQQFEKNYAILETKYQKQFKKYMKCLFKYGIYQTCMNSLIGEYNKLVDLIGDPQIQKVTINQLLTNNAMGDQQMEKIIHARLKRETQENQAIFYSGIAKPPNLLPTVQTVSTPDPSEDRSRSFSQASQKSTNQAILELLKKKNTSRSPQQHTQSQHSQQSEREGQKITLSLHQMTLENTESLKISTMKGGTTFNSQQSQNTEPINYTNAQSLKKDNDMSSQIQITEQSETNTAPPVQSVRVNQALRRFEFIESSESVLVTERVKRPKRTNENLPLRLSTRSINTRCTSLSELLRNEDIDVRKLTDISKDFRDNSKDQDDSRTRRRSRAERLTHLQ